jgi:hypothetical protein
MFASGVAMRLLALGFADRSRAGLSARPSPNQRRNPTSGQDSVRAHVAAVA